MPANNSDNKVKCIKAAMWSHSVGTLCTHARKNAYTNAWSTQPTLTYGHDMS